MARRVIVAVCAVAVLAAASAAGAEASTGNGIRVQVTFAGSGTFTASLPVDQITVQGTDSLSWTSVFEAVLRSDGTLVPSGRGSLTDGPGAYQFSDPSTGISCGGPLPMTGDASQPALTVARSQLTVPAIGGKGFALLPGQFAACRTVIAGRTIDESLLAGTFAGGLLDMHLPGVLSARVTVPSQQQAVAGETLQVSQAGAPAQLPSACADLTNNAGCRMSLAWSGTVTIKARCAAQTVINCRKLQSKAKARASAKRYRHELHDDSFTFKANRCQGGISRSSLGYMSGAAGFCAGAGIRATYDSLMAQHLEQIANDPPDPAYAHVARPHSPHATGMPTLRRFSPVAATLMRRYLRIAGLLGAVVTAQNRATGALQALSAGDAGAAADLARQNRALRGYAHRAAGMLRGQPRLARLAAAQLRAAAAALHGRASGHFAKLIRGFASSLVAGPLVHADRLAAAALAFKR